MNQNQDSLLTMIGLKAIMNTDPKSKDYYNDDYILNSGCFGRYQSKEYLSSGLLDGDEVYVFRNIVLLHRETGVRCEYAVSENYEGHAQYKIIDVFIITLSGEKLLIESIDPLNKTIIISNGYVIFSDIKYDSSRD